MSSEMAKPLEEYLAKLQGSPFMPHSSAVIQKPLTSSERAPFLWRICRKLRRAIQQWQRVVSTLDDDDDDDDEDETTDYQLDAASCCWILLNIGRAIGSHN